MDEMLSFEQARARLGVTSDDLKRIVKDGMLRAHGSEFRRADVEALRKRREGPVTDVLVIRPGTKIPPPKKKKR